MISLGSSGLHGRGVFARRRFQTGELIERAPVLVVPACQLVHLDRTALYDYYFAWGEAGEDAALAMGLGAFYNHAVVPNADHLPRPEERAIDFIALRPIEIGEEITIHYLGDPGDSSPMWFEVDR